MSYQIDLKCYKYHDRNIEMWKCLRANVKLKKPNTDLECCQCANMIQQK